MKSLRLLCLLAALAAFVPGAPAGAADSYAIDVPGAHFYAGFKISHMGFSDMHGRFNRIAGGIVFDGEAVENSSLNVTIYTDSIDTNHEKRDAHLRSPDFFNALEFPNATFVSTKVEMTGEKTGKVSGDLTILGLTKPLTLDVTLNKAGPHPRKEGRHLVGFSATGVIKRSDFGMTYGIPNVGDEVTLILEAEAIR